MSLTSLKTNCTACGKLILSTCKWATVPNSCYPMKAIKQFQTTVLFSGSPHLTPVDLFFCAALSSCFASLLTQPADVLKTRRQMFPWIRISYRFIIRDIYEVRPEDWKWGAVCSEQWKNIFEVYDQFYIKIHPSKQANFPHKNAVWDSIIFPVLY